MESGTCDQNDYLTFLLHLFNGHSSFELMHDNRSNNSGEFFIFQNEEKFKSHFELCQVKPFLHLINSYIINYLI